MSVVALTLFGDELPQQEVKTAVRNRAYTTPQQVNAVPEEQEPEVLRGWEADKQYYGIGKVAALFGVKTSHIRFWTTEFELKVRTNRKGDRLYSPENISELRAIYHLVKERGFTITGAKAKLKEDRKLSVGTADLRTALLQLRSQLMQIRNQLK
ncbi:MerR family transcriptional regulator [Chitinophagaceae bacterium MMS25-I14]